MRTVESPVGSAAVPAFAPAVDMLGSWPGPAMILHRDGAMTAGGDAGPIMEAARDALLIDAVVAGIPAIHVVTAGAGAASKRFECAVMPVIAGESALVLARDVTLEAAWREALTESRQRYKDLVEISGDFCWETGPDGRFVFVSPHGAAGWNAADLVGRDAGGFVEGEGALPATLPFSARVRVDEVDLWFRRPDGGLACFCTTAMPLFDRDDGWVGTRGLCRDVTEARSQDDAFARAGMRERLLAHVARTVRDEIEPARMIAAAARVTARALAAADCRIVGTPEQPDTLAPKADGAVEAALIARAADAGRPVVQNSGGLRILAVVTIFRQRPNGAMILTRETGDPPWSDADCALAGDVAAQIGIALAQLDRERRLEALSRIDPLTGLLNRRAFDAELTVRMEGGGLSSAPGALLVIDLDNFKPVNDLHGHARGDEALRAVAQLLQRSTRAGDLVARLGGDEFAVWLGRADAAAAAHRAGDLMAASRALASYSGTPGRPFGLSIGAAVCVPGAGDTPERLVARADAAMYGVKRDGKGGFAIARPLEIAQRAGADRGAS